MQVRAGSLRKRAKIQQIATAQNTFGEAEEAWTDVANVWVEENPLEGKEYFAAKQINAELTTKIRMRYRPDILIKPEMRILLEGRTLEINSVVDIDGRKKVLELLCSEVV